MRRFAIDGAGLGSAIAANKIPGARAAMCLNETLARYARQHNGANVLALGSTLLTTEQALQSWTSSSARRCARRATSGGSPRSATRDPAADLMEPADVQRLVQIIVEELAAGAGASAALRCHALLYECCPDRLRGVIEAGATRLGLHAAGGATAASRR